MRNYHLFVLLVPSFFMLLISGCQIPRRSQAPPTPRQRPFLGIPVPFESGPPRGMPSSPRPYEEPKLITPPSSPPPPAPAVSSLNRPSKVVRSNRSGIFTSRNNNNNNRWVDQLQSLFAPRTTQQKNKVRFDNPYPQHLSASQFNKLEQQERYQINQGGSQQVALDQSVSSSFDQPIALGFDSRGTMPQSHDARMPSRPSPSLYEQREQKLASNYSGIDNWNQANWYSSSRIEDWKKQQRPRQMTPSNMILPVMSVPQDASADDVERWPHLERKVEPLEPVEVLEAPVFDEDEDHVIIIRPRR